MLHLPRDDGAVRRGQLLVARPGAIEDLDGVEDGRQRIAQLVRQHRQKLVLAAIGLAQLPQRALALVLVDQGADPLADRAVEVADGRPRWLSQKR